MFYSATGAVESFRVLAKTEALKRLMASTAPQARHGPRGATMHGRANAFTAKKLFLLGRLSIYRETHDVVSDITACQSLIRGPCYQFDLSGCPLKHETSHPSTRNHFPIFSNRMLQSIFSIVPDLYVAMSTVRKDTASPQFS